MTECLFLGKLFQHHTHKHFVSNNILQMQLASDFFQSDFVVCLQKTCAQKIIAVTITTTLEIQYSCSFSCHCLIQGTNGTKMMCMNSPFSSTRRTFFCTSFRLMSSLRTQPSSCTTHTQSTEFFIIIKNHCITSEELCWTLASHCKKSCSFSILFLKLSSTNILSQDTFNWDAKWQGLKQNQPMESKKKKKLKGKTCLFF